tara:strand:- start:427 stop:1302 length:876 start_codon:yes stop_codon:yes gene_type:complete
MVAFKIWLDDQQLSKNSVDQYKSNFKVLTDKANVNVLSDSQERIISALKELGHKPSTQRTILATAVAYMASQNKSTDKIQQYRRQIQRQLFEAKVEGNKTLSEELPSSKQIISHELLKYDNKDYRGFIVCNLLRLLHCRNQDLQLCLVRDRNRANRCPDRYNYIVLDDTRKQILVIRRRYKTSETYGIKRRTMHSKKLYDACDKLLGEKDHEWLLTSKKGVKVKDADLSRCVCTHTYDNLNEGTYNKVFVSEVKEVKDFYKLQKISEERGTTVGALLDYYHTDTKGQYFNI